MAAAYTTGDKVYIVESNRAVRECTVVRECGGLYIIRFCNGGGIQVKGSRLFETRAAAEETVPGFNKAEEKLKKTGYKSPYDHWY